MRRRGFSLVEVLVAMLILAIVITTTLAMFTQRQKRLRQAHETILAYQALSNEAEYWRRSSFDAITDGASFQSDLGVLEPMQPYTATVHVESTRTDVKNVTLSLTWDTGEKHAKLSLVRVQQSGELW